VGAGGEGERQRDPGGAAFVGLHHEGVAGQEAGAAIEEPDGRAAEIAVLGAATGHPVPCLAAIGGGEQSRGPHGPPVVPIDELKIGKTFAAAGADVPPVLTTVVGEEDLSPAADRAAAQ